MILFHSRIALGKSYFFIRFYGQRAHDKSYSALDGIVAMRPKNYFIDRRHWWSQKQTFTGFITVH